MKERLLVLFAAIIFAASPSAGAAGTPPPDCYVVGTYFDHEENWFDRIYQRKVIEYDEYEEKTIHAFFFPASELRGRHDFSGSDVLIFSATCGEIIDSCVVASLTVEMFRICFPI